MSDLSDDFDDYVNELSKRNRLALILLIAAATVSLLLVCASLGIFALQSDEDALLSVIGGPETAQAQLARFVMKSEAMNALNIANVCANLAVAAAIRIWYTRQDKMTTLLTHAMVLEGENETAIRVLLNRKMRR